MRFYSAATACLTAGVFVLGCKQSPRIQPSHRGLYIGGPLNVFSPCGDRKVYWVDGTDIALGPLGGKRARLTGAVPRPVYIEVRAKLLPRTQAEYDGTLQVDTVLALKARRPPDCGLAKGEKIEDPRDF